MKAQSFRRSVIRTLTVVIVGMISAIGVRAETGSGAAYDCCGAGSWPACDSVDGR